jgi:hypothetical protein
MFPAPRNLSTLPVVDDLLPPREESTNFLEDKESGGVALGDTSQGNRVKTWVCTWDPEEDEFLLEADDVSPVVIHTAPEVDYLSFTFDQNMRWALAYQSEGESFLRWYDTSAEEYSTLALPEGSKNPRCVLDDARFSSAAAGISDIILFYIRSDKIYYRLQRDRYLTEYELYSGVGNLTLVQVGMNRKYRLQLFLSVI